MKDIPGYEGLYAATEDGKIWSYKKNSFIDPNSSTHGYKQIQLWKNGKYKTFRWHRLIALTFIPNPNNLPEVNHKDENKFNNAVDNLEWCERNYNHNYGTRNERTAKNNMKKVICVETGEIFESVSSAAASVNRCANTMSKHLKGGSKTCGGLHWEYI